MLEPLGARGPAHGFVKEQKMHGRIGKHDPDFRESGRSQQHHPVDFGRFLHEHDGVRGQQQFFFFCARHFCPALGGGDVCGHQRKGLVAARFSLPQQRHGFGDMNEYFYWRMVDYFTDYLIDGRQTEVDIPQR